MEVRAYRIARTTTDGVRLIRTLNLVNLCIPGTREDHSTLSHWDQRIRIAAKFCEFGAQKERGGRTGGMVWKLRGTFIAVEDRT
jgi:hypothetical protein